jgi:hypothetical protein
MLKIRPRNRWQDDVREDGRLVGGKEWKERVYNRMEEAPANAKELLHSAHVNGMNVSLALVKVCTYFCKSLCVTSCFTCYVLFLVCVINFTLACV